MQKVSVLKTIATAFSMFSQIPMPYFDWDDSNTRYMLVAFPLVGLVVGTVCVSFYLVADYLAFSNFFISVLLLLLPIFITGGIHLDGYCDTADARSSHQPLEKKLAILSDPHIGAFGVIGLICYLALFVAVIYELEKSTTIWYMLATPIISRSFSGFSVVSMQPAKPNGLGKSFSDSADKKIVTTWLAVQILIIFALLGWFNLYTTAFVVAFVAVTYIAWRKMVTREFGGVTGDLSGMLTQKLELTIYLALVVSQKCEVFL